MTTSPLARLEACPFCGGEAVAGWSKASEIDYFGHAYVAHCDVCVRRATIEEAINAWNRRTLRAEPVVGEWVSDEAVLAALSAQPFVESNDATRVWQTLSPQYHLTGSEQIMRAAITAALPRMGGES